MDPKESKEPRAKEERKVRHPPLNRDDHKGQKHLLRHRNAVAGGQKGAPDPSRVPGPRKSALEAPVEIHNRVDSLGVVEQTAPSPEQELPIAGEDLINPPRICAQEAHEVHLQGELHMRGKLSQP